MTGRVGTIPVTGDGTTTAPKDADRAKLPYVSGIWQSLDGVQPKNAAVRNATHISRRIGITLKIATRIAVWADRLQRRVVSSWTMLPLRLPRNRLLLRGNLADGNHRR